MDETMPVKWMSKEKSLKILEKQVYGRLATSDKENHPYITPVNYIVLNEKIYFHCSYSGKKIDNIKINPNVCFEVSSAGKLYTAIHAKNFSMRFWSILVTGKAKQISDNILKFEVLEKIMEKYAAEHDYIRLTLPDTEICNIIEISIDEISGKVSVDP